MSTQNTTVIDAPKPPRSEAQKEAARRNGAKSRGPISPMGKANSSRNALRHGLTAFHLTLTAEDQEAFNLVLADFRAEYRPKNPTEHSLVEQIAIAQWGMYRAWTAETAALNVEIEANRAKLEQLYTHFAEPVRVADAIETSLARTTSLPHINRCNIRVTRDFYRAVRELRQIRKAQTADKRAGADAVLQSPSNDHGDLRCPRAHQERTANFAETTPAIPLKTQDETSTTEAISTPEFQDPTT